MQASIFPNFILFNVGNAHPYNVKRHASNYFTSPLFGGDLYGGHNLPLNATAKLISNLGDHLGA